jgi:Family of unknown function (DUF6496)
MAARQSKAQKETIGRVMHEYKHGELKTRGGRKVKNERQALAIGLSEAGASRTQSKAENRENLRRTKRRERRRATAAAVADSPRQNERTRSELYEEARRRNIAGRSKMDKSELQRALQSA